MKKSIPKSVKSSEKGLPTQHMRKSHSNSQQSGGPLRILVLPLYPDEFSSRVRVGAFLPWLEKAGYLLHVIPAVTRDTFVNCYQKGQERQREYHLHELFRRIWSFLQSDAYDFIWVQKGYALFPWQGLNFIRRRFNGRLVFDLDDDVLEFPPVRLDGWKRLVGNPNQVQSLVQQADLVLCGNPSLVDKYSLLNPQTVLFPSTIPLESYPSSPPPGSSHPSIVWLGTSSNAGYLKPLLPAFTRLLQKHPGMSFRVMSDDRLAFDFMEGVGEHFVFQPWSQEGETAFLGKSTVGIMPLVDDEWARHKCGYKILKYFACGLPVVASPVGVNRDLIIAGQNGFPAQDINEWIHTLDTLLNDPEMARQMGCQGRALVEQSYSTRTWAVRLDELFQSLHPRPRI
jgi:glycosyltransferase involved in cell wall biosynthesis